MDTKEQASCPDATSGQEQSFSKVLPWVVLVGMMFLLNYLDRAMFGPMLPALESEFGITHSASTRFLFYMSLGYSLSMFLSGFSSAKIRPRIMVVGSLLGCGVVLQLISLTSNLTVMALLFFCLGLVAGQYFNGGLSTMRSLVPPSQWSKAIAVHEIGPNGSFFIAPILAEVGINLLGWRGTISAMGWLTIAAAIFFLFAAKGGEYPASPVSFKGFKQALKEPRLWLFTWLMGLSIAGEFAPFSVLTLHMVEDRAMAPDTAAFLLSASRVAAPFAVIGGGFITTRLGTRRTLIICLLVYTLGMFAMASPWLPLFLAGIFVQPVLTAMTFPPIFTLLAESFPLKDQPLLLGIGMPIASFMGVGIMPSVLGLWGDAVNFNAGFLMMGCMVAVSLPLVRLMPSNAKK